MTFYASYPARSGGVPTYANLAAFPSAASAGNGALAIALDTDILYISTGAAWEVLADPSGTSGITSLTGDVTATGPGAAAATVAQVGGSTAAAVHQAAVDTAAAASADTVSTLVKRDASGNFSATTITAALTGTASGNANKALSNLTTTAINIALLPDQDQAEIIGNTILAWLNVHSYNFTIRVSHTEALAMRKGAGSSYGITWPGDQASGTKVLQNDGAGTLSWATPASGTVTSVDLTVPSFLSVSGNPVTGTGTLAVAYSGTALPVANGGSGLTSGTSGGILGYTASGTLASSGALTANQLVKGGGAGATPSTLAAGSQFQVLVMGASAPGYGQVSLAQSAAITGLLLAANGGTASDSSAASGIAHVASGAWTYSAIVNADVSSSAAIVASKLVLTAITAFALRDTSAAFDLTFAATSSTALTAGRTLTFDVVNAARTVKLTGNLTLAADLTTSGANPLTFTTTGSTNVTLPTSGTLATNAVVVPGTSNGLVSASGLTGNTTGAAIAAGFVGETLGGAATGQISTSTTGNGYTLVTGTSFTLTTGVWLLTCSAHMQVSTVSGAAPDMRLAIRDVTNSATLFVVEYLEGATAGAASNCGYAVPYVNTASKTVQLAIFQEGGTSTTGYVGSGGNNTYFYAVRIA